MSHPVDIHVGRKVRALRIIRGLTLKELADKLEIKFQQVQKYETGKNRISASRLWGISKVLGVEIPYFFDGFETNDDSTIPLDSKIPNDILKDEKAMKLLRLYFAIPKKQRNSIFKLVAELAQEK
jgi:transcriptional regulator with XRE-family HTH domain